MGNGLVGDAAIAQPSSGGTFAAEQSAVASSPVREKWYLWDEQGACSAMEIFRMLFTLRALDALNQEIVSVRLELNVMKEE